jgi:putative nucleotidyltransferase with HDIG domain
MRPITKLAQTAQSVAGGDLTARSGVATSDEIGLLARTFDTMTGNLQSQHFATVRALASAIDARDPYTLGHSVRVGKLATRIGESLGLSRIALQHLEIGGYLHDIGKIGVRDAVLLKAGGLTQDERRMIEDHPRIGLQIVESIELPNEVLQIIGDHHERLDGRGYPRGLQADEVTIFARIASVADFYDALTTDRPYRPALTAEEVLDLMDRQAAGGGLDRMVVDTLARIMPAWEAQRSRDASLQGLTVFDKAFARAS